MSHPPRQDSPNKLVKVCFEEVNDTEDGVKALKVYIEMPDRQITEEVLNGEDRTLAEAWGAEVFDFVHLQLRQNMNDNIGDLYSVPRKDEMN